VKKINKIKSNFFTRNLSIGKMALKAGKNILLEKNKNIFENIVHDQLDQIVNELGLMKGSVTKAGQMLSLFGDAFLPPKARDLLKKLENQTYFLAWDEVRKNIPDHIFNELEIDEEPIAAASLGQVHQARIKETDELVALKIQYKGVKKAIDNDLKVLKMIFTAAKIIPKEINVDDLFVEIKKMLLREVDYTEELEATKRYKKLCSKLDHIYVPKTYEKYSNHQILCTEWIEANQLRDQAINDLPQDARNDLAERFFDLFFQELYSWDFMQTDAHFGNYQIRLGKEKKEEWICLDLGAHKDLEGDFIQTYKEMMSAVIQSDRDKYFELIEGFGIDLNVGNRSEMLWEYCEIVATPFSYENYNWGDSDIPQELFKRIPLIMKEFSGGISFDGFFIDRKVAGVFFMMKHLKADINVREIFDKYL